LEHLARVALLAMLVRAGPAAPGGRPHGAVAKTEVGVASYYDSRFDSSLTASGVRYNENALTAAHHTLPFGTRVRVTNLANHRSVVVTINDRGRLPHGRVIDLSRRAASRLGFLRSGLTRVRVKVLGLESVSRRHGADPGERHPRVRSRTRSTATLRAERSDRRQRTSRRF